MVPLIVLSVVLYASCCGCHVEAQGSCKACKVSKRVSPARVVLCRRTQVPKPKWMCPALPKVIRSVCPFPDCLMERCRPASRNSNNQSRLRAHGPNIVWKKDLFLLLLAGGYSVSVVLRVYGRLEFDSTCSSCKKSVDPVVPARAQNLPELRRNRFAQVSLGVLWMLWMLFCPLWMLIGCYSFYGC